MASTSCLAEDRITVHMTGAVFSQMARLSHDFVGSCWTRESGEDAPSSDVLAAAAAAAALARPSLSSAKRGSTVLH
jgi:hypothetical protein